MKKIIPIIKLLLLLLIVLIIPVNLTLYHHDIIDQFKSFEEVTALLGHYKWQSILIYIGMQTLQIVISVIPGQVFQFAAGYLWTFLPGLLFSLIGASLGTCISFFIAKILGKDAMHLFLGEEKTAYYVGLLNNKRAYTIVFLLYLIPGIPKDIVNYVAGISSMDFKPFLTFSMLGRIPGMAGSLLIGAFYMRENYVHMGIVIAMAVIFFAVGVIYRKKILLYLHKLYEKVTR